MGQQITITGTITNVSGFVQHVTIHGELTDGNPEHPIAEPPAAPEHPTAPPIEATPAPPIEEDEPAPAPAASRSKRK